jgi:hypothetical protein
MIWVVLCAAAAGLLVGALGLWGILWILAKAWVKSDEAQ